MTPARDTRPDRPRTDDPKGNTMKTDPKLPVVIEATKPEAVIGTLLGIAYMIGMPVAFIAVEVLAALALTGWLASGLWVIVGWNVWVLALRTWGLGSVAAKGADHADEG